MKKAYKYSNFFNSYFNDSHSDFQLHSIGLDKIDETVEPTISNIPIVQQNFVMSLLNQLDLTEFTTRFNDINYSNQPYALNGQIEHHDLIGLDNQTRNTSNYSSPLLTPQDILYSQQWHFNWIGSIGRPSASASRAGIEAVWEDYRGQSIKVGIWDDGVQKDHPDLANNYNALSHVTINGTLNNGQPLTSTDGHGTAVAGLIGAVGNTIGLTGIAYESQLTGIRIFGGADDINSNWSRYLQTLDNLIEFDITNHSYGGSPLFYADSDVQKFANASVNGRGGLGTLNVKSAGNSNIDGNGDALDASRHTVTVAATASNGQIASYSTYGAHILISAPAASVTTDLMGLGNGYDGLSDYNYTNQFGGTSASGPVTAGVIALMLDANDRLGWRDVQNILAYTANGAGSLYTGTTTNENFSWKWNAAENWNGGGMHYSEDYGYGIVNAFGAVRMAEVWSILYDGSPLTSANEVMVTTGNVAVNLQISDLQTLSYTLNVSQNISLEHLDLTINLNHTYFTDLRIRLTSPSGTTYTLYNGSSGNASTADIGINYSFGVDGLRGEKSQGTWTLSIQDAFLSDTGTLNSINFTGYGSLESVNDVYHYTEGILDVIALNQGQNRINLSDSDGGIDWINAAAFSRDLVISLESGNTSTIDNQAFLTISNDGTVIENIASGDGGDTITGNNADNMIYGGRGNDIINGGGGIDTAIFRGLSANYVISLINGSTTITGLDGIDTLFGIEFLKFDDVKQSVEFAPDITAPSLISSTPSDNSTDISDTANIILTFNENVVLGNGNITLTNGAGDTRVIIANDSSQVSVNNNVVTINPTSNLSFASGYYLMVEADAISDASGNDFIINNSDTLNFSTISNINIINGTSLADTLYGTTGDDSIYGFGENDTLDGGAGIDTLIGDAGDDTYIVDLNANGTLQDTITEIALTTNNDTVQLRGTSTNTAAATLTLSVNLEHLDASNTGSSLLNLTGNVANNRLTGNAANNILNGLAGADTMAGGAGNDTYVIDNVSDTVVENNNEGTDLVQVAIATAGGTFVLGNHVENATLINTVAYSLTGNDLNNILTGNAAANTLTGGIGNDNLNGLAGADTMIGGVGDDTYVVDNAGDIVRELIADAGTDLVQSSVTYSLDTVNAAGAENLTLTGTGRINGTGNGLNNTITGNSGVNILSGGAGDDTLIGGLGNDTLTGGLGADIFTFNTALNANNNRDTIIDFISGTDKIFLENAIMTGLGIATGALTADQFFASSTAVRGNDASDRIVYNTTSGALYYDADGSGSGAAVQIALIGTTIHPTLTNGDFFIV